LLHLSRLYYLPGYVHSDVAQGWRSTDVWCASIFAPPAWCRTGEAGSLFGAGPLQQRCETFRV